jgi:hypothetical protein
MGGVNIPLPALTPYNPQPQPNVADEYVRLSSLLGQQRLQQQQLQAGQQENQMRAMQMQDMQTIQKIAPQYVQKDSSGRPIGYDYDGLTQGAIAAGVRPQSLAPLQTMQKTAAETLLAKTGADKNKIANEEALNKQGFEKVESIKGITDPAQRQAQYDSALQWAQQNNVDVSKFPQQVPNNDMLSGLEASFGMHAQAVADAKDVAQTGEASSRAHEADVNAQKSQIEADALKQFGGLTPQLMEAKYVSLAAKQRQGQPLNAQDKAFMGAYEKQKTLVPTANFNLQNAGATGSPGQPSAVAQGLASGSMKWGDVVSARTPMSVKQALLAEVKSIKSDFNSGDFDVEQAVKKTATSGAVGQQLLAISTAREHMKTFSKLADALDNNDTQALNQIGNAIGVQFGSDKKTNFQIAAQAFGGEVGRALDGAGVVASEREQAQKNFNSSMSKGQFKGAVQTVDELLAGKQRAAHAWFDQGSQAKPDFGQTSAQPADSNAQQLTGKGAKWGIAPVGAQ